MRVIGFATTPREIADVLAKRRYELGLRLGEVDDLAGLHQGYAAKLECGTKHVGEMSLPALLATYGLRIAIVEDEAGLPRNVRRFLAEAGERKPTAPQARRPYANAA